MSISDANSGVVLGADSGDAVVARPPRFPSHALIEVRLSRWNPFARTSAVLIDMSVSGFKIQLVDRAPLKVGSLYYLAVPLEPFGIQVATKLTLRGEVKWVDMDGMRAGGIFVDVGDRDRLLIERVIAAVISRESGP